MAKTIEARLDHLQLYAICEEDTGLTWAGGMLVSATKQLATERAAIIADWNAMLTVINLLLLDYDENPPSEADNHPGWWGCRYCDGEQWDHPDRHTPDKCPVAAAQAALALMEGDLPADETVV